MGKIYVKVVEVTPIETRQKKDGSSSYQYASVKLQIADKDGHESTHKKYDWRTGAQIGEIQDAVLYEALYDKAVLLDQLRLTVGEWVIADIIIEPRSFKGSSGNWITTSDYMLKVTSVERQEQQRAAQPRY